MHSVSRILVILALVLRGLVPAGLMLAPSSAASGEMSVVICTGHGPMTVTLDADGKPVAPQPGTADHKSVCAFKAAGATAIDAAPLAISLPADYGLVLPPAHSSDLVLPDRQAVPPPARGPPCAS